MIYIYIEEDHKLRANRVHAHNCREVRQALDFAEDMGRNWDRIEAPSREDFLTELSAVYRDPDMDEQFTRIQFESCTAK